MEKTTAVEWYAEDSLKIVNQYLNQEITAEQVEALLKNCFDKAQLMDKSQKQIFYTAGVISTMKEESSFEKTYNEIYGKI